MPKDAAFLAAKAGGACRRPQDTRPPKSNGADARRFHQQQPAPKRERRQRQPSALTFALYAPQSDIQAQLRSLGLPEGHELEAAPATYRQPLTLAPNSNDLARATPAQLDTLQALLRDRGITVDVAALASMPVPSAAKQKGA